MGTNNYLYYWIFDEESQNILDRGIDIETYSRISPVILDVNPLTFYRASLASFHELYGINMKGLEQYLIPIHRKNQFFCANSIAPSRIDYIGKCFNSEKQILSKLYEVRKEQTSHKLKFNPELS